MNYFKNFPKVYYAFDIAGTYQLRILKDISTNVRVRKDILSKITVYDEYDILDSETPDKIAFKFYGDSNLFWIIMLINERYDWIKDFPMSQFALETLVKSKYGVGNAYAQHSIFGELHYETTSGRIVDSGYPLALPVTNYDYEFKVNESKRRIKIISPSLVQKLIASLDDIFAPSR